MANIFEVKQIIFNDGVTPLQARQRELVIEGILDAIDNAATNGQHIDELDTWVEDVLNKVFDVILMGTEESINELAKSYRGVK